MIPDRGLLRRVDSVAVSDSVILVVGRGKVETRFAESQPVRADGLEAARSLAW